MKNRWIHSNKAVFNINYHFVWTPKYRRNNLHGKLAPTILVVGVRQNKRTGSNKEKL